MKRASLWRERKNGRAQCLVCRHFCRLLPGEWGLCGVRGCRRINGQAEIFTLVETHAAAVHVDPIEKNRCFITSPGAERSHWERRAAISIAHGVKMPIFHAPLYLHAAAFLQMILLLTIWNNETLSAEKARQ